MVTSIRDLLDQVDQLAGREATQSTADDAVAALAQLARALAVLDEHGFAPPGGYSAAARRRHLCVRELAAATGWAAHSGSPTSWTPTPPMPAESVTAVTAAMAASGSVPVGASRRMTDCAGAAADLIARAVPASVADERWAAAAALAAATRRVTRHARGFGPFVRMPELVRVTRLSRLVGELADLDPPHLAGSGWLDRPVPPGRSTAAVPPADGAVMGAMVHAVAALVDSLGVERRDRSLSVSAALAAAAAAETAAAYATHLTDTITKPLRLVASQGCRVGGG